MAQRTVEIQRESPRLSAPGLAAARGKKSGPRDVGRVGPLRHGGQTAKTKKRAVRPRFQRTAETRSLVQCLVLNDATHEEIAKVVGLRSVNTLRKLFRKELCPADVRSKVGETLFQLATSGKCVAATIFWMKTRAGWRELGYKENKLLQSIEAPPMKLRVTFVEPGDLPALEDCEKQKKAEAECAS